MKHEPRFSNNGSLAPIAGVWTYDVKERRI